MALKYLSLDLTFSKLRSIKKVWYVIYGGLILEIFLISSYSVQLFYSSSGSLILDSETMVLVSNARKRYDYRSSVTLLNITQRYRLRTVGNCNQVTE